MQKYVAAGRQADQDLHQGPGCGRVGVAGDGDCGIGGSVCPNSLAPTSQVTLGVVLSTNTEQVVIVDVLEIRSQRLSTLLADFMICKSCGIVDHDHKRMRVGYKCPRCGIPGDGASGYFPVSVLSLIDLMQEFYHLKQEAATGSEGSAEQNESNHQLAIVIFFCALAEVLLQHFLCQRMSKIGLPHEVQDRLLDDNLFVKQRVQKLFPALTGVKWKKEVAMLSGRVDLNYDEMVEFYQQASNARNKFLHRGNKWAIPRDMPEQCIRHIWPLVCLFAALHNEYVARSI